MLQRPSGAGQGFRERPWSGDEVAKNHYSLSAGSLVGSYPNDPVWGYDERIDSIAIHSDQSLIWKFGQPVVADYLGDRISKVEVLDPGLYAATSDLTVSIEYESNGSLDFDFDGVPDFISAQVTDYNASRLTRFILDDNGSYDENISGTIIERGLFNEVPTVQILHKDNFLLTGTLGSIGFENEVGSSYIRLNDQVYYDADKEQSYLELYIDDRFPSQFFMVQT